jgi:hypothetical protein
MIHPRMMIEFVSAEPFQPFRLHMASGRTFEIRHPETIKVGRSSVTVCLQPEDGSNETTRSQEVSLMLLESIEPVEAASGTETH